MPDELEAEVLRRFVGGDRDAFEAIFRQFEARLSQLLRAAFPPALSHTPQGDLWRRLERRFEESGTTSKCRTSSSCRCRGFRSSGRSSFPMAVVPNMWGLWNMLHLAVRSRTKMSIGLHGALLPILLMPAGVILARTLDVFTIQWRFALPMIPVGMTVYYLAWKYVAGFLNEEMAIA